MVRTKQRVLRGWGRETADRVRGEECRGVVHVQVRGGARIYKGLGNRRGEGVQHVTRWAHSRRAPPSRSMAEQECSYIGLKGAR